MKEQALPPLAARIKELLDEQNLDPTPTAKKAGLSPSAIRNIFEGKSQSPRAETLQRLARTLKTSVDWLLTGNGEKYVDYGEEDWPPHESEEMAVAEVGGKGRVARKLRPGFVPEYDLRAGAGFSGTAGIEVSVTDDTGNSFTGEVARAEWGIPDYFLAARGMVASRTHILPIDGPSMIPDLHPDDRAIVDLNDINPGRDGIFAIWDNETSSVIVKNVQVVRGSDPPRIRCISSNKNYESFELELDGRNRVLGRIRDKITRV